ncbi:MAG: hypothetical protein HKN63_07590 [Rhodobacteraceae bacterium]|nr:hypothetical protein [Paracoccaceae bacterium]
MSDALAPASQGQLVARVEAGSVRLIEESAFAGYYEPIRARPCGGNAFTWTAALGIEFLVKAKETA